MKAGVVLKRIFALLMCLCMLTMFFSSAFAAFTDDNAETDSDAAGSAVDADANVGGDDIYDEYNAYEEPVGDDGGDIEERYADMSTLYDLENEEDVPPEPAAVPPPEDPDKGDDDSEIYGDEIFDEENAEQLQADYILDELIIKFKDPEQVPGKERQLQREIEKVQHIGFVEDLGLYVIKADDLRRDPNAVLNRYKNNRYVEYVEPNYIMSLDIVPNDPNYRALSVALSFMDAQDGWNILKGSSTPVIAVIDSGVASNPDMPPLLQGYSAVAGLSPSNDKLSHGTGVAGTIGCIGNNGIGTAGINWSASIMPVKIDDANGNISVANVAKGIIWAVDNGAEILNLSLGFTSDSITLKNAIDYAYNSGCAIFAATGNDGKNAVGYPARYSNVMGVGATGNGSTRVGTSNYGTGLDVVGFNGYVTATPSGGYTTMSGTSFASPQAAGLASLVWTINPELTVDELYRMIEDGCTPLGGGFNEQTGYGLLSIGNTLALARDSVAGAGDNIAVPQAAAAAAAEPELPPETIQEVRTPPTIKLMGFADMTLEYGQAYKEAGYLALDCKNRILTASVNITNNINIWTAGIYTVTYEVADSEGLTARATRIVTVLPQPVVPIPPEAPKITINGSNPIILHLTSGTPYKEQSAKALDYDGTDISEFVHISGIVNRDVAGTYTITYSITSPETLLTSSTTRDVRIVAPTELRDPRTKYGLNGLSKQGGVVTHTGIVSNALGFLDLKVSVIDSGMTISVQLVEAETKKTVLTDTFTAAGTKQYKIDENKYELVVTIVKANVLGKYTIELLMPEAEATFIYDDDEVPLYGMPQVAPIGSNPIILHIGGTSYFEQGARAADYLGNDISDEVEIIGKPDTTIAGTYTITYRVYSALGIPVEVTRDVLILDPNDETTILLDEVPLDELPTELREPETITYIVAEGDSLWNISQKLFGTGKRWFEIYDQNVGIIGPVPGDIKPGQVLKIRIN